MSLYISAKIIEVILWAILAYIACSEFENEE